MPVQVGTSGWAYADWKERFYAGVAPRRYFEHLMANFATVELNVSFYRLPAAAVFAGWRERSPADAVIAVKASRYLTHVRRLRDPGPPVALLLQRAGELGGKLGPVLVQLPPDLPADVDALAATLAAFPAGVQVAVEFRHPSWWTTAVRDLLERRGAALVWADRRSRPVTPLWRTASFGYLRMHEGAARRWPAYGERALAAWASRIAAGFADGEDVFAYFNNDPGGAAVRDAAGFAAALRRIGRTVTRTPGSGGSEDAQSSE